MLTALLFVEAFLAMPLVAAMNISADKPLPLEHLDRFLYAQQVVGTQQLLDTRSSDLKITLNFYGCAFYTGINTSSVLRDMEMRARDFLAVMAIVLFFLWVYCCLCVTEVVFDCRDKYNRYGFKGMNWTLDMLLCRHFVFSLSDICSDLFMYVSSKLNVKMVTPCSLSTEPDLRNTKFYCLLLNPW